MTQFAGRDPGGPTLQDAEALVRSLVGVAAVRIVTSSSGALREVVVVPESESMGRQVVRNVASALMAHFGVDLHPDSITLAARAADTDRKTAQSDVPATSAAARRDPSRSASVANGHSSAAPARPADKDRPANGTAAHPKNGTADAETARHHVETGQHAEPREASPRVVRVHAPVRPRLELAELVRAGSCSRCRVVVATGSERFIGVGDGEDGRIADIELAGRVAVDALRAARTPRDPIQFEGAVLVDIAGRAHVAVSLSIWTGSDFQTIAGAAPVLGSPAESAAQAVIDSIVAHLIA